MDTNKKNVFVFLADGMEEVEAITPIDYLRRVDGINVITVGIDKKTITGGHNISVICDTTIDEIEEIVKIGDMIVLPGGKAGTYNLSKNDKLISIIKYYHENKKYIAAICAAPSILGKLGMLENKTATVYPTFAENLTGCTVVDTNVVVEDNIITAKACGVSSEFSYALIEALVGKNDVNILREQIYDKKI